jgi:hypothetical protein
VKEKVRKTSWLPCASTIQRACTQSIFWGSQEDSQPPRGLLGTSRGTFAMPTRPLPHIPRRERGAPPRFPSPAHRAAPDPRAGMFHMRQKGGPNQQWLSWLCIYTLSVEKHLSPQQSKEKAAPPPGRRAQAGSKLGAQALGVMQRPVDTPRCLRRAPQAPLGAGNQFSCMGFKTVFFPGKIMPEICVEIMKRCEQFASKATRDRSSPVNSVNASREIR